MSDVTDQHVAPRRALTIGDLVLVPIRRWFPVFLTAMLALIAGAAYLVLIPPKYTATSVVLVRPVVENPFSIPSGGADRSVNMNVENGIANGNEVVNAIAAKTAQNAEDARGALNVEVPVGTQILRFLYSDVDEGKAITGANTAAEAYLAVRQKIYADQRDAQLKSIEESIDAVAKQLNEANGRLPRATDSQSPQVQAALERVTSLNQTLADLTAKRSTAAAINVSPGTITRTAAPPAESSRSSSILLLVAALVGGILAGVVLSFVRESMDRRVRNIEDTAEALRLPALAEIRSRKGIDGADMRYAALAVASRLAQRPGPHRLVVLSARANEGRAAFYERLAAALEKQGHAVQRGIAPPAVVAAVETAPLAVHVPDLPVPKPAPGDDGAATVGEEEWSHSYPLGEGQSASETTLVLSLGHRLRDKDERGADVDRRQPASVAVEMAPAMPVNGALHGPPAGSSEPVVGSGTDDNTVPVNIGSSFGNGTFVRESAQEPGARETRVKRPEPTPAGSRRILDDGYTLVNAAPAEADEQGVRDARGAAALVVVARDRTRIKEVKRLVERLRVNGVEPLGFVVVPRRA
jgi:capsular polysaccharide biosynthesis protein